MSRVSVPVVVAVVVVAVLTETSAILVSYKCQKTLGNHSIRTYSGICYRKKPVDGGWSEWSVWQNKTTCNAECNGGTLIQEHSRTCDNPPPSDNGARCSGPASETREVDCNVESCKAIPTLSRWSLWRIKEDCILTCGSGGLMIQERTRTCSDPTNGGSACKGPKSETREILCQVPMCKVHGGWSKWSLWKDKGVCNATCGGGILIQERMRACDNPKPAYGGSNCTGNKTETRELECNIHKCKVHGGWSKWSVYKKKGICTVTCGGGDQIMERSRTCDNPKPNYGGSYCSGNHTEQIIEACNTAGCKVDGGWNQWGFWRDQEQCSVTCGGGNKTQERARTCDNPKPAYGGADCEGDVKENRTVSCATEECQNGWGNWTSWDEVEECTVLCGKGTKLVERSRICETPLDPQGCVGDDYQNDTVTCGEDDCGNRCPSGESRYLPHPTNPGKFYQCSNGVAYLLSCADGQEYQNETGHCIPVLDSPATTVEDCEIGVEKYIVDPLDCTMFYQCVHGNKMHMHCPGNLVFDPTMEQCTYGECNQTGPH